MATLYSTLHSSKTDVLLPETESMAIELELK